MNSLALVFDKAIIKIYPTPVRISGMIQLFVNCLKEHWKGLHSYQPMLLKIEEGIKGKISIFYKMSTSLIDGVAINLCASHPNPFWRKTIASNIIH